MRNDEVLDCIIIGSGPAGYTAAIYAARADLKVVVYEGSQPGGQLMDTTDVDNYPGYPNGISGPKLMSDLKSQCERFGAEVKDGWVSKVDFSSDIKKVFISDSQVVLSRTVIIATGASAKWLGIPSEYRLREMGGGISACAVCDGFFYKGEVVAVVGGGDTAIEEATYLAKMCKEVNLLVRGSSFRASKAMQNRLLKYNNINVLFNTEVCDIIGESIIDSIRVFNKGENLYSNINVSGLFIAIGHTPNTSIFKDEINIDNNGYIITIDNTSLTNVDGVFAAGDVSDNRYRQAITAAGSGCKAAMDAEKYLLEK